ncbi:MAG: NUDIX domain-containing protein [Minisyncoccia bacterium]
MSKKKIKHILVSAYYTVINPFRTLYCFVFRPPVRGAKAVIFCEDKVLLARISYGHKRWTFPGGGVGKNESFRDGALREMKEEVGIEADSAEFFYEYHGTWQYCAHTVQCFAVHVSKPDFVIDEQEIVEAAWFHPDNLPENIRPSVKEVLLKYSDWAKNKS